MEIGIAEKVFQYRHGNVWKQGFLFIHGFVYQITLGCIRGGLTFYGCIICKNGLNEMKEHV